MTTEVIENPNGDLAKAQALCRYIATRRDEILAAAAAIHVTADNWNDPQTKDAVDELEAIVEDLRERGKMLVETACAATEAQRVITAIDSRLWSFKSKADPDCAYAKVKGALDGIKAQIKTFKDAATPKAPPRSFIVRIDATDKQFDTIAKAAVKCGAVIGQFCVPQSDKAVKTIQKWFEENM